MIELAHDQPVRASHAWFDIARVRSDLGQPEAAIEEARSRAVTLNPTEPRFKLAIKPRRRG
ncbi:MAG: hypothetical protein IPL61_03025 [Myxococcales bacterium]|nr:hypothetical protein [Myxococcales bacterium]